jgi:hypothetical protein
MWTLVVILKSFRSDLGISVVDAKPKWRTEAVKAGFRVGRFSTSR